MSAITPRLVTMQDLGDLCLRATVAFAARCARRVRPGLDDLPDDFPDLEEALATVDAAIEAADNYARAHIEYRERAEKLADATMEVAEATYAFRRLGAFAAAHAARAAAEAIRAGERADSNVAMEVVASAYGANRVALTAGVGGQVDSAIQAAIFADFENLKQLRAGSFRDLGDPIDPAEDGPLGPLWPKATPASA